MCIRDSARTVGIIYETRFSPLEGNAVDFRMPDFAALAQARIVDDHRFGLIFANGRIKPVLLPVGVGLVPHAVEP